MCEDDVVYFTRRVQVEHARARQATEPRVMAVHDRLEQAYREKLARFAATGRVRT